MEFLLNAANRGLSCTFFFIWLFPRRIYNQVSSTAPPEPGLKSKAPSPPLCSPAECRGTQHEHSHARPPGELLSGHPVSGPEGRGAAGEAHLGARCRLLADGHPREPLAAHRDSCKQEEGRKLSVCLSKGSSLKRHPLSQKKKDYAPKDWHLGKIQNFRFSKSLICQCYNVFLRAAFVWLVHCILWVAVNLFTLQVRLKIYELSFGLLYFFCIKWDMKPER